VGQAVIILAVVVAVVALVALAVVAARRRAAEAARESLAIQRDELGRANHELQTRVSALARYESVLDAQAYAQQIRVDGAREVESQVAAARSQAAEILAEAGRQRDASRRAIEDAEARARAEADRINAEAQRRGAEHVRMATEDRERAKTEAARLVAEAQRHAQEIAGVALEARGRAAEYQETVRALQNVIEGYGDRYLVPAIGLLDELAEEFGSKEAGEELKLARAEVRAMVTARTAAICDYAEEKRRTTAENFVLDAFNGKVESILADVRHDNYGTLAQKTRDAYALVNLNGQAFRNARIAPTYLEARLNELRWAVVVNELKQEEREEQRRIKEQIREEERARKEFERAIKEAEKEEDLLRKAMEKAQKEIAKASDTQRAKYEEQLRALEEKLRLAEEKSQRALSMAQQTKAGHVYIISNVGSFGENVYKVGMTRRLEPLDRVRELGDASVPFEFDVHAMINSEDAPALERALHKRFVREQVNKVNPRKEFFRITAQQLREEVEAMGLTTRWTMAAECREWKETLAIEHAMKSHTFDERAWESRQVAEHDRVLREATAEIVE
jgi:hypothetical protein